MLVLAVTGSALIGIILLLFANRNFYDNAYILIVNCKTQEAEERALALLEESVKRFVIKAKTVSEAGIELTAELRMKHASTAFVNRIQDVSDIEHATLVSYNGEYLS